MSIHLQPGYQGRMNEASSTVRTNYTPAVTAVFGASTGSVMTSMDGMFVALTAGRLDWEAIRAGRLSL